MKIGVLSFNLGPNYGWILQSYALQRVLEKNGYESVYIYRRWDNSPNSIIAKLKRFVYFHFFVRPFYLFFEKKIKHTRPYTSTNDLRKVVRDYDLNSVIVGSDQIWRLRYTYSLKFNYFLDFVHDPSVKKIAYAPSFGHNKWEGDVGDTAIIKSLLKQFIFVSVREKSGVDICKNVFDVQAQWVLDPTMLLTADDYNQLLPKKTYFNVKTLATYILDKNNEKDSFVATSADVLNAKIYNLYPTKRMFTRFKVSIEQWLCSIRDAEFVIVDSFHGMVFSILFNKQFIAIVNKERGAERFETIADILGLRNRLIYDISNVNVDFFFESKIDYFKVNNLLSQRRAESLSLLMEALK